MKNWKSKLTSKTFWLSLAGAVVIALQCFGVRVDAPYVNEAVSAVCSVFVVLGIMRSDGSSSDAKDESEQDATEIDKDNKTN